jgi:small GTP-binding protein
MVMPKLPKVVIVGETNVGKSTYFLQLTDQHFGVEQLRQRNPTIACAVADVKIHPDGHISTQVHVQGSQEVQVWDTAGQERFRSLLPMYYRHAKMVIVIHEGTSRTKRAAIDLIDEISEGYPDIHIYMIQNKSDACAFDYSMLDSVGDRIIGWSHVEALGGKNVKESFLDAIRLMNARDQAPPTVEPDVVDVVDVVAPPLCRWFGGC